MPTEPAAVEDRRDAGRQGQLADLEAGPPGAPARDPGRDLVRLGGPDEGVVEGFAVRVLPTRAISLQPDAGHITCEV